MAAFITTVHAGPDSKIVDVQALDADANAVIPHGLGVTPQIVNLTPLVSADTVAPGWIRSAADATNVTITKLTGEGTGGGLDTVRVLIQRPHTIGR